MQDGELTDTSREKISKFISSYLPQKAEKETYKNRLFNMENVKLLDNYGVEVNLKTGNRYLRIPFLDVDTGVITPNIIEENDLMLKNGVWGVGELFYIPPKDSKDSGAVAMRSFKPFQIGKVDTEYYSECRKNFTTEEWIDLIISSMGYNPYSYTGIDGKYTAEDSKITLITRLLPMVEPRTTLVELAPKGTGKSFVYNNISRYGRVTNGGSVSPAVMFYNNVKNSVGLIARYDVVVLDEVQSAKADAKGELIGGLKTYLESGKFDRGNTQGTSECGFVMLGNIDLSKGIEAYETRSIFEELPEFMQETAFIDRIHGVIPGWIMPRITNDTPSKYLGFKGDYFAEILHAFRAKAEFSDYIQKNMKLKNCDDMRDYKAVHRLATGYLKILFPDMNVTKEEFIKYCVKPAVEMRQRVRDELHKMDKEFKNIQMGIDI